ncbi:hypothetical protein IAT40_005711 [Kwoniella sp. CBS 6097]
MSSPSYLCPCRHGEGRFAADKQILDDVNTISDFLTSPSNELRSTDDIGTVYVLAGNAILPLAERLFDHIESLEAKQRVVLVISGGIGHSTSYLYEAILRHPKYHALHPEVEGKSEAEVLHIILLKHWPRLSTLIHGGAVTLLIDWKSTNCGANAVESKKLLDGNGIWPKNLYIIQDPTMHRRTCASFEKIYVEDERSRSEGMPALLPCSYTPHLAISEDGDLCWSIVESSWTGHAIGQGDLWDVERFVSLVMGEIPRLRDDKEGYGPKGAGYIPHVAIPTEVEEAWTRLSSTFAVRKA